MVILFKKLVPGFC